MPGLPKQPPFIAAAQGPTKVQPPSDETVASANDAGANSAEGQRPARSREGCRFGGATGRPERPGDGSGGRECARSRQSRALPAASPMKGTGDAPVVVMPSVGQPPAAQQFPDPKPVRTVSLQARRDANSAIDGRDGRRNRRPLRRAEAPKPPCKAGDEDPRPRPATRKPSTPKLDVPLPTKLSGKSSARVAVAKTDTTAPGATADTQNEPVQLGGSGETRESRRKRRRPQQAAVETGSPRPRRRRRSRRPPHPQRAGPFNSPRRSPRRKPRAPLRGSTRNMRRRSTASAIGVHKAVVKGETIYRLRVVGLSKADAAALCARLKGDGGDCFIAK